MVWTPPIALAVGSVEWTVLSGAADAPSTWPAAVALGIVAGLALFAALACRFPRGLLRVGRRRLGARLVLLGLRSGGEEVVWRWLVLGSLAPVVGWPAALAASTAGFAFAHAGSQGRRGVAVHVVTGMTFGAVFLATGGLAGAVAAHCAYNALVALAVEGELATPSKQVRPPPVSDVVPASLMRVSKRFGRTEALRSVDLVLREGEIVALLGPNGAGKSTAVSILLGLRRPNSGRATLFGLDPRLAHSRRRIGATPQEIGFSPTLRVTEIVDFVRSHYAEPAERDEILRRFGLVAIGHRQAGGLSAGQRRRLAVALAFAGNPAAVFLDEPTAGLDVASRRAVWDGIRRFRANGGSVLLTTHALDEVEALATRVAVLSQGRVVADTTVSELKARAGLRRIRVPEQELPVLSGVVQSSSEAGGRLLYATDAGQVVRGLVACGADLGGIEILPVSLEEAFLAVTRAPP